MFRTGEFSHLARVSKRLLQFYDEIGLLKPAFIDRQTGYRYYSAKQLPRLNRILALKDLGFSLDQIQEMLQAEISDAAIQGMLLLKKAEVEQTVLEELQRLRSIEARLQQNRLGDDALEVVVKSIPAQRFLSVRTTLPSPEELLHLLHLLQRVLPSSIDQRTLGPLAGVVYTDGFTLRNNDVELGYLLKKPVQGPLVLADAYELRMRDLPAVQTMATAVQAGGPDLVFTALGRIGHWIEVNGYRIAGPYREIGLDLPTSGRFDEMVIEVQMPIEHRNVSPDLLITQREEAYTPPERITRCTSTSKTT
jgi:DNA-binding transcriptional MerR regulator